MLDRSSVASALSVSALRDPSCPHHSPNSRPPIMSRETNPQINQPHRPFHKYRQQNFIFGVKEVGATSTRNLKTHRARRPDRAPGAASGLWREIKRLSKGLDLLQSLFLNPRLTETQAVVGKNRQKRVQKAPFQPVIQMLNIGSFPSPVLTSHDALQFSSGDTAETSGRSNFVDDHSG